MMRMTPHAIRRFREKVQRYYRSNGRDFPWRRTTDPYRILVSEIMLQQTQADRVVDGYERFVRAFPHVEVLARAPLRGVLRKWQGLGYNRRALMLKRAASDVVAHHNGSVPRGIDELVKLPGVGPYTAAAVAAFAFNKPVVMIETNIRSAFIHHFFPRRRNVADAEILPLVERTLVRGDARQWYSALMDYGAYLKRSVENPGRRSRHHHVQGTFAGSRREVRGKVIRALVASPRLSPAELGRLVNLPAVRLSAVVHDLCREGLVVRQGQYVTIGTFDS